jgi:hypothetical protein
MGNPLERVRAALCLAPLAGRGRIALAIRVRGSLRVPLCLLYSLIDAPHPNPLPARAGREFTPYAESLR